MAKYTKHKFPYLNSVQSSSKYIHIFVQQIFTLFILQN